MDLAYASRGGIKLEHALRVFGLEVAGLVCADFGCSVGGFTDCLLQHGASGVTSVDTAYGELAWKLRTDPRVVVMERTNALHAPQPERAVDLVVIDLGWTPQRLAVPAALGWTGPEGRIITLIKPHYELSGEEKKTLLTGGVLGEQDAEAVVERTCAGMPALGAEVLDLTKSPILGSGSKKEGKGNAEWLGLLRPTPPP